MYQLNQEIDKFKNRGQVIINGDFNARMGNKQDFIEYSKYFDNENHITSLNTNSKHKLFRNS